MILSQPHVDLIRGRGGARDWAFGHKVVNEGFCGPYALSGLRRNMVEYVKWLKPDDVSFRP